MNAHDIGRLRSLAYHREVARRIEADPAIVERAKATLARWLDGGHDAAYWLRQWEVILDGPLDELARVLTGDEERFVELRASSPFAGALSPRERWRIWREVRELNPIDRERP